MLYTFRTQSLNEYAISAEISRYSVTFNGATIGNAATLTGAHLIIISALMRGMK